MNLPSFIRATYATGFISLLLAVSGYATPTPPYLVIRDTPFKTGSVVSGAAAHLNNSVYFAGGTLSTGAVSDALTVIDQSTRKVTALASMPVARTGLGLVAFWNGSATGNDVLYAIGGSNGTSPVGNVEMYNVTTGTWTELAPLNSPRAYLAVVGGNDGNIYAIGGVDGSGATVSTVEIYNTTTNTWSYGPSLNTPRSHLAASLTYTETIFAAGGVDASGTVLNTTEVYSLATGGSWANWVSMNVPRADFGLSESSDGYLHALGGRSTSKDVDSIEGYSFADSTWTVEPHHLRKPISGIAATESLSGAVFVLGGANGKIYSTTAKKGFAPPEPSHSVSFYIHQYDEPYINGDFALDQTPPLSGVGLLSIALLSSVNFTSFPAVNGTIESGGSLTVTVPSTLIVGAVNGLTVSVANLDGSDAKVVGQVSSVLGLSGTVNIPITTPLKINNKVLILNISTLVGVDLNLGGGLVTVTLNGLDGKPSNP
jgi:Kelch motif